MTRHSYTAGPNAHYNDPTVYEIKRAELRVLREGGNPDWREVLDKLDRVCDFLLGLAPGESAR